jgi:hypothetical protein
MHNADVGYGMEDSELYTTVISDRPVTHWPGITYEPNHPPDTKAYGYIFA